MRGTVLICFLTLIPATDGQDIDTVLFSGAHQTPSATDRTEDPVERRDFAAIFQTKNAAQRHALAVKFVDAHPQSWLLAQAYDIGAKASIDLGNYWTAIDEARFSLRLLPENPILLIQIANIEAQLGAHEAAERDARYAAEFLDEFTNPTTVSDSKWCKWKRELSASAWLAVVRSLAARGTEYAEFRQGGVSCEMCHGPAAAHIRAMRDDDRRPHAPADPPVDFLRVDNRAGVRVCAQCHMHRPFANWEPVRR
jgi:tetratricopeptide (TPR) repeat protein